VTEERTATIGNLPPASRAMFLRDVAAVLTPQDHFLLGVDLVKDVRRLEAAYNDAAGVTATFNLNVLAVMKQRARFELRVRSPGVDANGDQREVPPRRS
jgi:L-histidine Nalpha-methyltransferase